MRRSQLAAVGIASLVALAPADAQQRPPELSLVDADFLRIGSVEQGAPETQFASVAGAELLPSGEIVVADAGNLEVRWFDASGTHVRSVGAEGEGPGEFRFIHWMGACPGGEILVVDPRIGRGTILSAADGRVVRTVELAPSLRWNVPLSCGDDGKLVVLMDQLEGRVDPAREGRVTRVAAEIVRFDLTAGAEDTLRELPGSDHYYANRAPVFAYLPLGARALAAVGGAHLYAAQSDEDVVLVKELGSSGWTRFEHGLPRSPATREAWEAAVSEFVWRQPLKRTQRVLTEAFEEAPMPDRMPAFVALRADPAGRLWLRLPDAGGTTTWRIFDEEGRPVASLTFPPDVAPIDIGARRLAALERGPLDVPMIRVYPLPGELHPESSR